MSVEVKEMKTTKPFLVPEELPETMSEDQSIVEGLPKKYVPKWCNKNTMASNKKGIWVALDKTHPEFKDVRVFRDDTPKETFITRGDLILCVTHKDTYKKMKRLKERRVADRLKSFEAKEKNTLERASKEGIRAITGAFSKIDEELEEG